MNSAVFRMLFPVLVATILFFSLLRSLKAQPPVSTAETDLVGPVWSLVQFQGGDGKVLTPSAPNRTATYTLTFAANHRVSMRMDCNRGTGTWQSSEPNQLQFGPVALTRALCLPSPLSDRLPKDLENIRSYTLRDGHLFLALMVDAGIYEFAPEPRASGELRQLSGSVFFRERMALPPGAALEVKLEDTSKADASADVIARIFIKEVGNPPYPFTVPYNQSAITDKRQYTLRATIISEGAPIFTGSQLLTVLPGKPISLLLRRTAPPAASSSIALEGAVWNLTELKGQAIAASSSPHPPSIKLDAQTHRVSGTGGCNRLTGGYTLNGDQLSFAPAASTMMACISGMENERVFFTTLREVKKWSITDRELDLFDTSGTIVARFQPAQ